MMISQNSPSLTHNIYSAYLHIYKLCQYTCHSRVTPTLHAATSEWGRRTACYQHSISAFLLWNIYVNHDKMWCKICYFVILYFVIQDVCDILKSIFLGHPEPACARWRYASGGTGSGPGHCVWSGEIIFHLIVARQLVREQWHAIAEHK